jgi:transcriptional regulator with XRE-family HTH domain
MADRMKTQQPNYNRLETGKVSIKPEHIDEIANSLGKTNEEILSQLTGFNVTSTNKGNGQNNQNFVYYDFDKKVLDDKDVIIETQKIALSALNMTIKILQNKISQLEIKPNYPMAPEPPN